MTTKTKKAPAKKSASKKAAAAGAPSIPPALVARVIKMREKGQTWTEIVEALNVAPNFIQRVRPLMKKVNKKSVASR